MERKVGRGRKRELACLNQLRVKIAIKCVLPRFLLSFLFTKLGGDNNPVEMEDAEQMIFFTFSQISTYF